jgi:hypothetical protein
VLGRVPDAGDAAPVPRQQRSQIAALVVGDPPQHIREPSLGINVVQFAGLNRVSMIAARSPPRSEPANNHDFLPKAIPLSAR